MKNGPFSLAISVVIFGLFFGSVPYVFSASPPCTSAWCKFVGNDIVSTKSCHNTLKDLIKPHLAAQCSDNDLNNSIKKGTGNASENLPHSMLQVLSSLNETNPENIFYQNTFKETCYNKISRDNKQERLTVLGVYYQASARLVEHAKHNAKVILDLETYLNEPNSLLECGKWGGKDEKIYQWCNASLNQYKNNQCKSEHKNKLNQYVAEAMVACQIQKDILDSEAQKILEQKLKQALNDHKKKNNEYRGVSEYNPPFVLQAKLNEIVEKSKASIELLKENQPWLEELAHNNEDCSEKTLEQKLKTIFKRELENRKQEMDRALNTWKCISTNNTEVCKKAAVNPTEYIAALPEVSNFYKRSDKLSDNENKHKIQAQSLMNFGSCRISQKASKNEMNKIARQLAFDVALTVGTAGLGELVVIGSKVGQLAKTGAKIVNGSRTENTVLKYPQIAKLARLTNAGIEAKYLYDSVETIANACSNTANKLSKISNPPAPSSNQDTRLPVLSCSANETGKHISPTEIQNCLSTLVFEGLLNVLPIMPGVLSEIKALNYVAGIKDYYRCSFNDKKNKRNLSGGKRK